VTAVAVAVLREPRRWTVALVPALAAVLALLAVERPMLALAATIALPLVVLAVVRVEVGILVVVAAGPLEAAFNLGSGGLTVTKAAGAFCFATFALNALLARRRFRVEPLHGIVLLLLGIALVSMLNASDRTLAMTTTTRYASFVALFFVVSQAVRTERQLVRFAWVLSAASAAAGVLASWRFLSGETHIATLAHGDPNDLGFVLATTLPLTLWLLRFPGRQRFTAAALALLCLGSLLLTFSRLTLWWCSRAT